MNGSVVSADFKPKRRWHCPLPHVAAFNKTSADLAINENIAKLHFILEGSNIRR